MDLPKGSDSLGRSVEAAGASTQGKWEAGEPAQPVLGREPRLLKDGESQPRLSSRGRTPILARNWRISQTPRLPGGV